jgi:hypothetical protein
MRKGGAPIIHSRAAQELATRHYAWVVPAARWRHRSLPFNALLAFWQGLAGGLVGIGLALPFGEPAPAWSFAVPAVIGASWALPPNVTLTDRSLIIRNPLRKYDVALENIVSVEQTQRVSGWRGRTIWLRTTTRRIRLSALGNDRHGAASEALDLLTRERRSRP